MTIPLRFIVRYMARTKLILDGLVFVALSVMLLSRGIVPYSPGHQGDLSAGIATGAAKAAWWISLSLVLVNVIRHFVVFERRPREGRLVRDLLSGLVYIGTGLSLVAYVFNVPVGTLIATSGVFAIVLGLAMQSTLNDVFSGIALNLGQAYVVGDWIVLDDSLQGRVIETNWRSTHLLSSTNDVIILPNSTLAKSRLTNFSSPDESHGITVTTRFLPTERPHVIVDAMKTVLLGCTKVMRAPPPSVAVVGLDGDAITLELGARIKNVENVTEAKNEIYDLVYRHSRACRLSLVAGPIRSDINGTTETKTGDSALECLNSIPLFQVMLPHERAALSQLMVRVYFAKNQMIVKQNNALTSLILIERGVVLIENHEGGQTTEIARVSSGDFFGERGVLMGMLEHGDIFALTPTHGYEIAKDRLAGFLKDRPSLTEELAAVLSHRLERERYLLDHVGGISQPTPASLSAKIRSLFGLR
ncbi:mechanosensitive ion channel domain-containing protein [Pararhizobium arenae]|uniref:mechanosensitive ion channel domain-containing protein n=1 Tax=Pararhizobium arenae TaxID=1856850 RepID=UPI001301618E|nr:mechanosensitive ion channel family protein [Pararhizobium arenae]